MVPRIIIRLLLLSVIGNQASAMSSSFKSMSLSSEIGSQSVTTYLVDHIKVTFRPDGSSSRSIGVSRAPARIEPYMMHAIKMQVTGNQAGLENRLADLNALLRSKKSNTRKERKEKEYIEKLLKDPVTVQLRIIKTTRSLSEACEALGTVKSMKNECGYDAMQVAQELFNQRADYQQHWAAGPPMIPKGMMWASRDSSSTSNRTLSEATKEKVVQLDTSVSQQAIDGADMVSTPAHSVPNISWEVDAAIQKAFEHVKQTEIVYGENYGRRPDFKEQMKAVGATLDYMKEQGLLKPSKDAFQEAVRHGIVHFLKEFDPSTIVGDPQEFIINTTQHIAIATFHVMTDGVFLGAERAAALGMQIYDLYELINTDYTQLSPNQRAELVAERVADIIKTIFADQIVRKIAPKIKALRLTQSSSSTSSTAQESYEVVTPEGVKIKVQKDDNSSLLKKATSKTSGMKREKILPKVKTYEQARNKALEIIGEVDVHTGEPHLGRLGTEKGKIVGRRWHNRKVIMRVDYDPVKGPHVNITDYRLGKGLNGKSICIPFEGGESTYQALVKGLNSMETLKQAKTFFESKRNFIDSGMIDMILKQLSK